MKNELTCDRCGEIQEEFLFMAGLRMCFDREACEARVVDQLPVPVEEVWPHLTEPFFLVLNVRRHELYPLGDSWCDPVCLGSLSEIRAAMKETGLDFEFDGTEELREVEPDPDERLWLGPVMNHDSFLKDWAYDWEKS
jgi:hypothetical protein